MAPTAYRRITARCVMDLSNWKELILALVGGGVAKEVGARIWRSVTKQDKLVHEADLTRQMFTRASDLETRLLSRISELEHIVIQSEIACRQEIRNVRQEYETRISETHQKHMMELIDLNRKLASTSERCSVLEREVIHLRSEKR